MTDPVARLFDVPDDAPTLLRPDLRDVVRRAELVQARRRAALRGAGVATLVLLVVVSLAGAVVTGRGSRHVPPAQIPSPSLDATLVAPELLQPVDVGPGWKVGRTAEDKISPPTVRCLGQSAFAVLVDSRSVQYNQESAWIIAQVVRLTADQTALLRPQFEAGARCAVESGYDGATRVAATTQASMVMWSDQGTPEAQGIALVGSTLVNVFFAAGPPGAPQQLPQATDPVWLRGLLAAAVRRATGTTIELAAPTGPASTPVPDVVRSPDPRTEVPDSPARPEQAPPAGFLRIADLGPDGTWRTSNKPGESYSTSRASLELPGCDGDATLTLAIAPLRQQMYRPPTGDLWLTEQVGTLTGANVQAAGEAFARMAKVLNGCRVVEPAYGPYPSATAPKVLALDANLVVLGYLNKKGALMSMTAYGWRGSTVISLWLPGIENATVPGCTQWAIDVARAALDRAAAKD